VLTAVKKPKFLLNQMVLDLFIAGNVTKNIDQKGFSREKLALVYFYFYYLIFFFILTFRLLKNKCQEPWLEIDSHQLPKPLNKVRITYNL